MWRVHKIKTNWCKDEPRKPLFDNIYVGPVTFYPKLRSFVKLPSNCWKSFKCSVKCFSRRPKSIFSQTDSNVRGSIYTYGYIYGCFLRDICYQNPYNKNLTGVKELHLVQKVLKSINTRNFYLWFYKKKLHLQISTKIHLEIDFERKRINLTYTDWVSEISNQMLSYDNHDREISFCFIRNLCLSSIIQLVLFILNKNYRNAVHICSFLKLLCISSQLSTTVVNMKPMFPSSGQYPVAHIAFGGHEKKGVQRMVLGSLLLKAVQS